MRVSTKGRYGLRAMVDLAVHGKGDYVALNRIADRQEVSDNYLEQVFSALRKAGLVKSVKGAQGGYVLARHPSEITVGMILRVLEGSLSVAEGVMGEATEGLRLQDCIARHVWTKLDESINSLVDSITLEELAEEQRKMDRSLTAMYYI